MYLTGSRTEGGPWSDDGIKAIAKFVGRVKGWSKQRPDKTVESEYGSVEEKEPIRMNTAIGELLRMRRDSSSTLR